MEREKARTKHMKDILSYHDYFKKDLRVIPHCNVDIVDYWQCFRHYLTNKKK